MTQTYKVQVSMNQAHIVESGFVWKQGDFGFNIEIEVLDFDVTGVTPALVFRKGDGAVEATTGISVSSNKFTYTIRGTELETPGPCICDLKLKNSTTQRISTASFKYFVVPDTEDGLSNQAHSYSDTIAQIVGGFDDDISRVKDSVLGEQKRSDGFYIDENGTVNEFAACTNVLEVIVDGDPGEAIKLTGIVNTVTNPYSVFIGRPTGNLYGGTVDASGYNIATLPNGTKIKIKVDWDNFTTGINNTYANSHIFITGNSLIQQIQSIATLKSEIGVSYVKQHPSIKNYPSSRLACILDQIKGQYKFTTSDGIWQLAVLYNESSYSTVYYNSGWTYDDIELLLDGTKYLKLTYARGENKDQNVSISDSDKIAMYKLFNEEDANNIDSMLFEDYPFNLTLDSTRTIVECGALKGKYNFESLGECWCGITLFSDNSYTTVSSDLGWSAGSRVLDLDGTKYVKVFFAKGDSKTGTFIATDKSNCIIAGLRTDFIEKKIADLQNITNSHFSTIENEISTLYSEIDFDRNLGSTRAYVKLGSEENLYAIVANGEMYASVVMFTNEYSTVYFDSGWQQGTYYFKTDGAHKARVNFAKGSSKNLTFDKDDIANYKILAVKNINSEDIHSIVEPSILYPPINSTRSMTKIFNSIRIGEEIQNKILDFKQPGDMLGNGIGKFDIMNGYMYLAQSSHDGPDTAEDVYYHCYIRLFKIKMSDMTIENMEIVAERGGSYLFSDGNTYTYPDEDGVASPYYGIVTCKDGYVYVNHSAPFTNGAKIVRLKVDPADLTVLQRDICSCTGPVDYCSNNNNAFIIGIAHQGFVKRNNSYYGGVSKDFKTVGVIKTDDFINFESFYELPIKHLFNPFEEVGLAFDTYNGVEYMYLAIRTQYYEKSFVYVYKISVTGANVKQIVKIADCHSQPAIFWYDNRLILHSCGPVNRDLYCFTEINREDLTASEIIADIDEGSPNANTQIYVDANKNIYMTMTRSYIAKIRLDYVSDSTTRSILSGLLS